MEQTNNDKVYQSESREGAGVAIVDASGAGGKPAAGMAQPASRYLRRDPVDSSLNSFRPRAAEALSSESPDEGQRPTSAEVEGDAVVPERPHVATLEVIQEQNEESKGGSQYHGFNVLGSQSALPSPRSRMTSFQNLELVQKQGSFTQSLNEWHQIPAKNDARGQKSRGGSTAGLAKSKGLARQKTGESHRVDGLLPEPCFNRTMSPAPRRASQASNRSKRQPAPWTPEGAAALASCEQPEDKQAAEAPPSIHLDNLRQQHSQRTPTVPPRALRSQNRDRPGDQVLFSANATNEQRPTLNATTKPPTSNTVMSQARSRISEQTKTTTRKRGKASKAPKNFYDNKNVSGLQALDLNEGDLLMKTYNGTESFKQGGFGTRRHQDNLSMTIRPTTNAYCNINDMGDMTLTNKDYQENEMLNSTYDNLLSFKGGKELKEQFQLQQRQRQCSVYSNLLDLESNQDYSSGHQSRNSMTVMQLDIPKSQGYASGGQSRLTSLALTKKKEEMGIMNSQSAAGSLAHGITGKDSDGSGSSFTNYNFMSASRQLLTNTAGQGGFAVGLNDQQLQQIKIHENIAAREDYLNRLQSCRSSERPKPTLSSRCANRSDFLYCKESVSARPVVTASTSRKDSDKSLKRISSQHEQNSEILNLQKHFRRRQNSESQLQLGILVYYRSLKAALTREKMISDCQMLEIREIIEEMQKHKQKVNYFSLILNDAQSLVDFFIDTSYSELLQIALMKEIIQKFETLKQDLNRKIQIAQQKDQEPANENSCNKVLDSVENKTTTSGQPEDAAGPYKISYSLSLAEINNLKFIFNQIRCILTRFGRILTYINKINSGRKAYLIKVEMQQQTRNPSSQGNNGFLKLPPHVKRIIEQQRKNQGKPESSRQNSTSSSRQPVAGEERGPTSETYSLKIEEKRLHPSRVLAMNKNILTSKPMFEVIDLMKLMNSFPVDQKQNIVMNYHKQLIKKWKDNYDQQRMQNIPQILCRACNRQFYADMSLLHKQYCMDKMTKTKAQYDINYLFMNLSIKATQTMMEIQNAFINVPKTPKANQQSPIATPTSSPLEDSAKSPCQLAASVGQTHQRRTATSRSSQQLISAGQNFQDTQGIRASSIRDQKMPQRFTDLLPEQKAQTTISPLLAYSMNQNQISNLNIDQAQFPRGFEGEQSSNSRENYGTLTANIPSQEQRTKDGMSSNQQSQHLQIITEVLKKAECENQKVNTLKVTDTIEGVLNAHDSKNMIDIADIDFPPNDRVKNLIRKYDDVFNLSASSIPSVLSLLPNKRKPLDARLPDWRSDFIDFDVKNRTLEERKRTSQMLKEHVQSIMSLKENCFASQDKSTSNAFSIKLKNYAMHVSQKTQAKKETNKQKSLLEKRLTVMLGTQKQFRAMKEERQRRNGNLDNILDQRNKLMQYRFIQDPRTRQCNCAKNHMNADKQVQRHGQDPQRKCKEDDKEAGLRPKSQQVRAQDVLPRVQRSDTQKKKSSQDVQQNLFLDKGSDMLDKGQGRVPSPILQTFNQIDSTPQANDPYSSGILSSYAGGVEERAISQTQSAFQKRHVRNRQLVAERRQAQKQLELMENLKTLVQQSWEMSQINYLFGQQIRILRLYKQKLEVIQAQDHQKPALERGEHAQELVQAFIVKFLENIAKKITTLTELEEVEIAYNKTLPVSQLEDMKKSLQQFENAFEQFQSKAELLQKIITANNDEASKSSKRTNTKHKELSVTSHQFGQLQLQPDRIYEDELSDMDKRSSTLYSRSSQLSQFDSEMGQVQKKPSQPSNGYHLPQSSHFKKDSEQKVSSKEEELESSELDERSYRRRTESQKHNSQRDLIQAIGGSEFAIGGTHSRDQGQNIQLMENAALEAHYSTAFSCQSLEVKINASESNLMLPLRNTDSDDHVFESKKCKQPSDGKTARGFQYQDDIQFIQNSPISSSDSSSKPFLRPNIQYQKSKFGARGRDVDNEMEDADSNSASEKKISMSANSKGSEIIGKSAESNMFEEIDDNVSLAHKTKNSLIFNTPNSKRFKELDRSTSFQEDGTDALSTPQKQEREKSKSEEESVNSCDIDLGESSNESIFSGVGQEINQVKKPQSIRLKEAHAAAEASAKTPPQHQIPTPTLYTHNAYIHDTDLEPVGNDGIIAFYASSNILADIKPKPDSKYTPRHFRDNLNEYCKMLQASLQIKQQSNQEQSSAHMSARTNTMTSKAQPTESRLPRMHGSGFYAVQNRQFQLQLPSASSTRLLQTPRILSKIGLEQDEYMPKSGCSSDEGDKQEVTELNLLISHCDVKNSQNQSNLNMTQELKRCQEEQIIQQKGDRIAAERGQAIQSQRRLHDEMVSFGQMKRQQSCNEREKETRGKKLKDDTKQPHKKTTNKKDKDANGQASDPAKETGLMDIMKIGLQKLFVAKGTEEAKSRKQDDGVGKHNGGARSGEYSEAEASMSDSDSRNNRIEVSRKSSAQFNRGEPFPKEGDQAQKSQVGNDTTTRRQLPTLDRAFTFLESSISQTNALTTPMWRATIPRQFSFQKVAKPALRSEEKQEQDLRIRPNYPSRRNTMANLPIRKGISAPQLQPNDFESLSMDRLYKIQSDLVEYMDPYQTSDSNIKMTPKKFSVGEKKVIKESLLKDQEMIHGRMLKGICNSNTHQVQAQLSINEDQRSQNPYPTFHTEVQVPKYRNSEMFNMKYDDISYRRLGKQLDPDHLDLARPSKGSLDAAYQNMQSIPTLKESDFNSFSGSRTSRNKKAQLEQKLSHQSLQVYRKLSQGPHHSCNSGGLTPRAAGGGKSYFNLNQELQQDELGSQDSYEINPDSVSAATDSEYSSQSQEEDSSDKSDSIQIISPKDVRFHSLHRVLPSEKESCSIDNINTLEARVTINDFLLIKSLASGAYGKVILSRKKNTKDMFAIKVLEIAKMKEKNCQESIMNEKNILNDLHTDFITRGVYTFKSTKYLYMVMEYMKGGDLANLLEESGYFEQEMARYYIAQLVLALEQLHLGGVIHRDLKPDNILIDKHGHIKLTDFGLSENAQQYNQILSSINRSRADVIPEANTSSRAEEELTRQASFVSGSVPQLPVNRVASFRVERPKKIRCVGTADYIAPEVLKGEPHTFRLDFWSLGIIVYEFLTGSLPFNAASPELIFENILAREIQYPPLGYEEGQMTPEAHDFIEQLLNPQPAARLGSGGIQEVKDHAFFSGLDWDTIMTQEAPFKPIGRDIDTIYFPKANDKDDDLRHIINDQMHCTSLKIDKDFQDFEGTCYQTLFQINQQKANDALKRAQKKKAAKKVSKK